MSKVKGYYYDGAEICTTEHKSVGQYFADSFFVAPSVEDLITHKLENYNFKLKNAQYKKDNEKIEVINKYFDKFMEAVERYNKSINKTEVE